MCRGRFRAAATKELSQWLAVYFSIYTSWKEFPKSVCCCLPWCVGGWMLAAAMRCSTPPCGISHWGSKSSLPQCQRVYWPRYSIIPPAPRALQQAPTCNSLPCGVLYWWNVAFVSFFWNMLRVHTLETFVSRILYNCIW